MKLYKACAYCRWRTDKRCNKPEAAICFFVPNPPYNKNATLSHTLNKTKNRTKS